MAFISFSDRRSAIPDAVISVLENPLPDFVDVMSTRRKPQIVFSVSTEARTFSL